MLSSGARSAFELRGPPDVANLATLFGLSQRQAKARFATFCRPVLGFKPWVSNKPWPLKMEAGTHRRGQLPIVRRHASPVALPSPRAPGLYHSLRQSLLRRYYCGTCEAELTHDD